MLSLVQLHATTLSHAADRFVQPRGQPPETPGARVPIPLSAGASPADRVANQSCLNLACQLAAISDCAATYLTDLTSLGVLVEAATIATTGEHEFCTTLRMGAIIAMGRADEGSMR